MSRLGKLLVVVWVALSASSLLAQDRELAGGKLARIEQFRGEGQTAAAQRPALTPSDAADPTQAGFKIIQALGLCCGVFFIGLFLYRKYAPKMPALQATRRIRIKERLALTRKTALMLVECDGRSLLVSVGPESVSFCEQGLPLQELHQEGLGEERLDEEREFPVLCEMPVRVTG